MWLTGDLDAAMITSKRWELPVRYLSSRNSAGGWLPDRRAAEELGEPLHSNIHSNTWVKWASDMPEINNRKTNSGSEEV